MDRQEMESHKIKINEDDERIVEKTTSERHLGLRLMNIVAIIIINLQCCWDLCGNKEEASSYFRELSQLIISHHIFLIKN